jgi:hypothetical protein
MKAVPRAFDRLLVKLSLIPKARFRREIRTSLVVEDRGPVLDEMEIRPPDSLWPLRERLTERTAMRQSALRPHHAVSATIEEDCDMKMTCAGISEISFAKWGTASAGEGEDRDIEERTGVGNAVGARD